MPRLVICCYCGARSRLEADRSGMLACDACGAPIQQMGSADPATRPKPVRVAVAVEPVAEWRRAGCEEVPAKKNKKRKKRKGLISRALEEVWDKVEDIFD
ncbi:hypothetical protein KBY22_20235 [Ruegeria pomeroyi]|nr:hypothetical protein [Ruegeria pomeroyi]MCE8547019.1 hypothetical protein [Ruegeria pomeroyi]